MENQNPPPHYNPHTETETQDPLTSDASQPLQTPPVVKASKFSIKAIIGTILFLLLAGGAAAGYVYREPILKLVSAPTPTPSVILSQTKDPSPTPDPTANWKTYEGNGISFKYPSTWSLNKDDSYWSITLSPDETVAYDNVRKLKEYQIALNIRENPKNLSAVEVWKERVIQDEARTPEFLEVTINGIKGIKVSNNSLDSYDIQYYFTNNNTIALFSLNFFLTNFETARNKYPNAEKTYDQILSTFKFTEIEHTNISDDAKVKNLALEFQNALIRYFTIYGAYPWDNPISENTLCKEAVSSGSITALSLMTSTIFSCINGSSSLLSVGEVKTSFVNNPKALSKIFVTWKKSDKFEVIVCSSPLAELKDSKDAIYSIDGSDNSANCPNTNAEDGVCYWCLR